jgi:hypothetical protein
MILLVRGKENCIREPGRQDAEDCGTMAGNRTRERIRIVGEQELSRYGFSNPGPA